MTPQAEFCPKMECPDRGKVGEGNIERRKHWVQRTPAMATGLTDHIWTVEQLMSFKVAPPPSIPSNRHGQPPKKRHLEAIASPRYLVVILAVLRHYEKYKFCRKSMKNEENLNLIERLRKFVRKQCLYSTCYATFAPFKAAISNRLSQTHPTHKTALDTLLTLRFQRFDKAQFVTV